MSRLSQVTGDDYPDAALKHLQDAGALQGVDRHDGCSYLAGYVVECSLKAVLQVERGTSSVPKGRRGHDLRSLRSQVAGISRMAGARTSKYVTRAVLALQGASIHKWSPGMRYQGPRATETDARGWLREAREVYHGTVGAMRLDGLL